MREKINCVYIIINKINGKRYIGSSIDFYKKILTHKRFLYLNKHHSKILQTEYNKYGLENFKFEIFQYTTDKERMETKEYYIKILNPEYNVSLKRSLETRLKMRETAIRINRVESLEKCRHLTKRKIIDSDNNIFESLTECAKFWNITPMTVCDIIKGRHNKTRKGITFKYV